MDYTELVHPTVVPPARTKEALEVPPGYIQKLTGKKTAVQTPPNLEQLKSNKAWELAIGPAKSIPMNLIMSYMTGNSLQIIPIMTAFMLLVGPLKSIFNDTNKMFKNLETEKNATVILQAKAVFVVCQLACMLIGVWKLNLMGLIPNKEADWLSFAAAPAAQTVRILQ